MSGEKNTRGLDSSKSHTSMNSSISSSEIGRIRPKSEKSISLRMRREADLARAKERFQSSRKPKTSGPYQPSNVHGRILKRANFYMNKGNRPADAESNTNVEAAECFQEKSSTNHLRKTPVKPSQFGVGTRVKTEQRTAVRKERLSDETSEKLPKKTDPGESKTNISKLRSQKQAFSTVLGNKAKALGKTTSNDKKEMRNPQGESQKQNNTRKYVSSIPKRPIKRDKPDQDLQYCQRTVAMVTKIADRYKEMFDMLDREKLIQQRKEEKARKELERLDSLTEEDNHSSDNDCSLICDTNEYCSLDEKMAAHLKMCREELAKQKNSECSRDEAVEPSSILQNTFDKKSVAPKQYKIKPANSITKGDFFSEANEIGHTQLEKKKREKKPSCTKKVRSEVSYDTHCDSSKRLPNKSVQRKMKPKSKTVSFESNIGGLKASIPIKNENELQFEDSPSLSANIACNFVSVPTVSQGDFKKEIEVEDIPKKVDNEDDISLPLQYGDQDQSVSSQAVLLTIKENQCNPTVNKPKLKKEFCVMKSFMKANDSIEQTSETSTGQRQLLEQTFAQSQEQKNIQDRCKSEGNGESIENQAICALEKDVTDEEQGCEQSSEKYDLNIVEDSGVKFPRVAKNPTEVVNVIFPGPSTEQLSQPLTECPRQTEEHRINDNKIDTDAFKGRFMPPLSVRPEENEISKKNLECGQSTETKEFENDSPKVAEPSQAGINTAGVDGESFPNNEIGKTEDKFVDCVSTLKNDVEMKLTNPEMNLKETKSSDFKSRIILEAVTSDGLAEKPYYYRNNLNTSNSTTNFLRDSKMKSRTLSCQTTKLNSVNMGKGSSAKTDDHVSVTGSVLEVILLILCLCMLTAAVYIHVIKNPRMLSALASCVQSFVGQFSHWARTVYSFLASCRYYLPWIEKPKTRWQLISERLGTYWLNRRLLSALCSLPGVCCS